MKFIRFTLLFLAALVFSTTVFAEPVSEQITVSPNQIYSVFADGDVFYCAIINSAAEAGVLKGINGNRFVTFRKKVKTLRRRDRTTGLTKAGRRKLRATRSLMISGNEACGSNAPDNPVVERTFDALGNVTATGRQTLMIPEGLPANLYQGKVVFDRHCVGCHEGQTNRTFPAYRTRTSQEPMFFTEEVLPDEELANLTAYLNRFRP